MLNILVICTGNSCRSVIAEALINHLGAGRLKAFSAGSQPLGRLNAGAVALLQRHGHSTDGFYSKSWDSLQDQPFDMVITVCDSAAGESCPVYLQPVPRAHWSTVDPGRVQGTEEQIIAAFEHTYSLFEQRINTMLSLPLEEMTGPQRVAELNKIGQLYR